MYIHFKLYPIVSDEVSSDNKIFQCPNCFLLCTISSTGRLQNITVRVFKSYLMISALTSHNTLLCYYLSTRHFSL